MSTVIAAIDLGPSSRRVLHHAAGFARLLSCDLTVLHVNGASAESRDQVLEFCRAHAPYELDFKEHDVVVAHGLVSDTVIREAIRRHARLIVVGSRGRGAIAKLILGSTADAVLRLAATPVLVVPPADLDIVDITNGPRLTCGAIIAAVDLGEACGRHVEFGAELSRLSRQPLVLMTVAPQRLDDHHAVKRLRDRAHHLEAKPRALIVRRGDVAEEITRCALSEGAGLVVMGRRNHGRATPGAIAAAVLKANHAFILAVPGRDDT